MELSDVGRVAESSAAYRSGSGGPRGARERTDDHPVERLYAGLGRDDSYSRHRMFGWPEPVQDPMQLECQLVSSGIWSGGPGGYRHPRAVGLAPGAADWLLLLQLDTDDGIGWM